jgi:trehalose-6-phosphatase
MIKIIFFDIDGTLLDFRKEQLSAKTVEALQRLKENGIKICIATGRSPFCLPKFEGVEFPAPGNVDSYLTHLYGDWRKLPTDEQIRNSMHYPVYIKEIFGEE